MAREKKIGQADIIGQQGILFIGQIVADMGFIFRPETEFDAGIDGHIEVRNNETGAMKNARVLVQSKATTRKWTGENEQQFSYTVKDEDVTYWLSGNIPTILIVSRPSTNEAYWTSIQKRFGSPEQRKDLKIVFDKKANRFTSETATAIADLALPPSAGKHITPLAKSEVLFSNLLPITRVGKSLYLGQSDHRNRSEVWEEIGYDDPKVGGEWILTGGSILSFYNLREEPWCQICDAGSVEMFDSEEWITSEDRDKQNELVQLYERALENHLWADKVYFEPNSKTFYFAPHNDNDIERKESSGRSIRGRTVVSRHGDEESSFIRHFAIETRFQRFADRWYLEVTPTYLFTTDGYRKHPNQATLLKGIKRLERNGAVSSLMDFWGRYLAPSGLFKRSSPFIELGSPEQFNVAQGISDDTWRKPKDDEMTDGLIDGPLFEVDE